MGPHLFGTQWRVALDLISLKRSVAQFWSSNWAGAAVAAFCTYIVTNAGTLSCAAGVGAICAGVTGDCDFLED